MKTSYLFHPLTCCLTDCLVRACTCEVAGVPGPDAASVGDALETAAAMVGDALEDGRTVEFLSGRVDEVDGVLHVHFMVDEPDEVDE